MQDLRFPDSQTLARQLAGDLANRMRSSIEARGRVCIAVSGGQTPVHFFQALAQEKLPWNQVLVTLVDERWVDEADPASNARLVRQYLLQGEAARAYFLPLKNQASDPVTGFMECENRLHEQIIRLDYAVLGLGRDGHTASWFPHSQALSKAMSSSNAAWCCPVMDAPEYQHRMTLTWNLLSGCRHIFLHFEGEEKDAVFSRAEDSAYLHDNARMPVRTLLTQSDVPLSIYRTGVS